MPRRGGNGNAGPPVGVLASSVFGIDVHILNMIAAATVRLPSRGKRRFVTTADSDHQPRDTAVLLGVLSAVERDSAITQRGLSSELGIALGLANAYLKRCVHKGWIKVGQVPLNRYAYYLTPYGFAEKSRLTAEYLADSFRFFRDARRSCAALLTDCGHHGQRRVALAGAGDLAEIAVLSAGEAGVDVLVVIDPERTDAACAGKPIVASLAQALAAADGHGIDAVIVTDTAAPQVTYEGMIAAARAAGFAEDRVLAPSLLRVSMPSPALLVEGSP